MQIYLCLNLIHAYKIIYYSFKIFLCFLLTKITRIIHHNQLLLTKFEKFLPYWTDVVKSAVKMQVIELLTEKTWGRVWVVFEVSNGEVSGGGTFYSFHGELLWKNIVRTARKQLEERHIWSIFADLNSPYLLNFPIKMHYRYKRNIDGKACFN